MFMKSIFVWMFVVSSVFAQDLSGLWKGQIEIPGSPLALNVTFDKDSGTIDIPDQGATGLALKDISLENETIHFAIDGVPGDPTFDGTMSENAITGTFTQSGQEAPFSLERIDVAQVDVQPASFEWPEGVAREPLTFIFEGGWVANGEIDYPATGTGLFPTIILLHGSGPNDMDQTLPGEPDDSKVFRQLGAYLPSQGFAVVRYNKRGVLDIGPKLDPKGHTFTLTQYINDATDVLRATKNLPQVDPQRIILLGHSEGTLTASSIAQSPAGNDLAGLVLMGIVGRDIKSVLEYQMIDRTTEELKVTADTDGDGLISSSDILSLLKGAPQKIVDANIKAFRLEADQSVESGYRFSKMLDKNGDGLLDLENELRSTWKDEFNATFPDLSAFGMAAEDASWIADTQTYGSVTSLLPGFDKPVLMLNGEADIQTVVAGATEAYNTVKAGGNTDITLKTYEGLGHSFYPAQEFNQPLGSMEDYVLEDLVAWLKERFSK
jgi:uncharacterized protein